MSRIRMPTSTAQPAWGKVISRPVAKRIPICRARLDSIGEDQVDRGDEVLREVVAPGERNNDQTDGEAYQVGEVLLEAPLPLEVDRVRGTSKQPPGLEVVAHVGEGGTGRGRVPGEQGQGHRREP